MGVHGEGEEDGLPFRPCEPGWAPRPIFIPGDAPKKGPAILSDFGPRISDFPSPLMPGVSPKPPESLSGLVERVTFVNEENGFSVLKVQVKGHRDLVTVVGSAASVNPGEWVHAEGAWVQDRQFGSQFRADTLQCTPPNTLEGMEKYLGSGMVKGIGPVYAKKLTAKFGTGIFDVIDHYSARLEEIDGIGTMRRRRIKTAWSEQKVVREIMVFLHAQGVSTSRAVRIYKLYGESAIERCARQSLCAGPGHSRDRLQDRRPDRAKNRHPP